MWVRKLYNFAIRPDMAFYFKVPIEVAIDRLLGGTRAQFKYYEAGMDMGLSQDITESFRIFQSRILAEYDKMVSEYGFITMDATKDIEEQQNDMRQLVSKALENYRPKRGTHGKRALFWRRFDLPKSEGPQGETDRDRGNRRRGPFHAYREAAAVARSAVRQRTQRQVDEGHTHVQEPRRG